MRTLHLFSLCALLVFAGAGCFGSGTSGGTNGGVFLSGDSGSNWEQSTAVLTAQGIGTLATSQILTMEMDPSDSSVIYIGTLSRGLLFTEDAGASWQQPRNEALKSGKIRDMEVDPTDECTVYVTNDQNLYKTTDCARDFDSEIYVETRENVVITRIAVDWYNSDILWIGLSNGDIIKSENGGSTWKTVLNTGSYISSLLVSNADSRVILASTDGDGFYRSSDQGETWTHIERDLSAFPQANYGYGLAQTTSGDTVMAATKYGLITSPDFGSTWESVELLTSSGEVIIKAFGIDPENPDVIYYAASSTFYQSNDGGETWTTSKLPTTQLPQYLLVNPDNIEQVYLGVVVEY